MVMGDVNSCTLWLPTGIQQQGYWCSCASVTQPVGSHGAQKIKFNDKNAPVKHRENQINLLR